MGIFNEHNFDALNTSGKKGARGPPGIGFKVTDDGNYDMENKKIVNIGTATTLNDVVDFKFVRNTFVNKRFPLVSSNLDMQSNITVSQKDTVNKEYGDTHYLKLDGTTHMTGDLDLRGNKIISPGEINMNRKLIKDLDTDENDDLSAVNMITLKTKIQPKAEKLMLILN